MLASPGPWRLGVAVALRSRSPQTAAELARSGSIRFYSILFQETWKTNKQFQETWKTNSKYAKVNRNFLQNI